MFSNGSEYIDFTQAFCERCNKHTDDFPLTEEQVCPIELKLNTASFTGEKEDFPYEDLKPIDNSCRYACKSFETDNIKLMDAYNEMMKGDM